MKTISVDQFKETLASDNVVIVDVRTPAEFDEAHVDGSHLCPLDSLSAKDMNAHAEAGEVYVMCRSGNRASKAIEKLAADGVNDLVLVEGGILACEKADVPLNRGRKVMSLDRQVRIAAGALVVVGAILGFLVHPYWHGMSAFVGAGLVFAGITDTCAMGMMIAKMPWNQRRATA